MSHKELAHAFDAVGSVLGITKAVTVMMCFAISR